MAKKTRRYSPRRWLRRRGRSKKKISIAVTAGLAGTILGGKGGTSTLEHLQAGQFQAALYRTCMNLTGFDPATGIWSYQYMNIEPLIAGVLVHMTLGRIANKYLTKIPYVNI